VTFLRISCARAKAALHEGFRRILRDSITARGAVSFSSAAEKFFAELTIAVLVRRSAESYYPERATALAYDKKIPW